MNGRRPQDPEAVIRRLSASLADRAGDYRITPAFAERVRRLRKRRHITLRAVQTMAVVIVLAVAGAGVVDLLRPSPRVHFVSPPSATPSPTAGVPSASPSAESSQPAEQPVPSTPPPPEEAEQPDAAPSPAEDQEADDGEPDEVEPRATRVILDGEPRPGAICREDGSTLIATIELPEAETGYVVDLTEPVTMRIMGEGFTDVSDTVERSTDGDWTVYTASFTTDNDDFGVSEVRIEGPADPDAC